MKMTSMPVANHAAAHHATTHRHAAATHHAALHAVPLLHHRLPVPLLRVVFLPSLSYPNTVALSFWSAGAACRAVLI